MKRILHLPDGVHYAPARNGEPARLIVDEAAAVQILREAWHAVKALRGEAPRVDEILFPKRST